MILLETHRKTTIINLKKHKQFWDFLPIAFKPGFPLILMYFIQQAFTQNSAELTDPLTARLDITKIAIKLTSTMKIRYLHYQTQESKPTN